MPYLQRKVRDVPMCGIWLKCGVISTATCSTAAIWVTKAISKKNLAEHEPKALELFRKVHAVQQEAQGFLKVKAVWQFFEAQRAGNDIHLYAPSGTSPIHTFRFGRPRRDNGLCLSDYILDVEEGRRDHLALFVVTAGAGIREKVESGSRLANSSRRCGVGAGAGDG